MFYGIGVGLFSLIHDKPSQTAHPAFVFLILIGAAVTTFIAHIWSLIFPISSLLTFLLVLIGACGLGMAYSKNYIPTIRREQIFLVLPILILSLLSVLTETTNVDEAGYYLPTVRWMEAFPVTKGSALFIARIGFNSGFHMLSAVFGFSDIISGGRYELNGLFFLYFNVFFGSQLIQCLRATSAPRISQWLWIAGLIFPFAWLTTSMDTDYLTIFGSLIIIGWLLDAILNPNNTSDNRIIGYAIIIPFLTTVKIFSALLFLGLCFALVVRQSSAKQFLKVSVILTITLLPWLIRNVLISGYLIFPLHYIDLFDLTWKVPYEMATASYRIIGEFAKVSIIRPDYLLSGIQDLPLADWVPIWVDIQRQQIIGWVTMLMLPGSLCLGIWHLITKRKNLLYRKRRLIFWWMLTAIVIFWYYNFPAIRFGWQWILTYFIFTLHLVFGDEKSKFAKPILYGLSCCVILSWTRLGYKSVSTFAKDNQVTNHTVEHKVYTTSTIDGIIMKRSIDTYCNGITPPCMPSNNPYEITPIGDSVEQGFRLRKISRKHQD